MTIRTLWLLAVWLAFLAGYTHATPSGSVVPPAQARIDAISMVLAKGHIAKIEIVQIPGDIETRTQVTPGLLERQFQNKVVIRNITQTAYRKAFVTAFQSTHVKIQEAGADLRWGVIFYSQAGTRVGALYFDKFGRHGAVDKYYVALSGDFFSWLQDRFSRCLQ